MVPAEELVQIPAMEIAAAASLMGGRASAVLDVFYNGGQFPFP